MKTKSMDARDFSANHTSEPIFLGGEREESSQLAPVAVYGESRRGFLGKMLAAGVTVVALPLLTEDAEADLFTPSINDQKKLGEQAAQQILQKYHEVHDSRASHFNQIGTRLVDALPSRDRQTWDYKFHVLESPELNAFALPGGPMFLFTGLMDKMKSDSEIAAVTGHEMTHVRKQHWAKAYANQQESGLVLGGVLKVLRAGQAAQAIAGIGDKLYSLRFSRGDEDQADAGGLQNMVDAGYDPHGMLDLFHTLQTASGSGQTLPFLSDHPLTSERIKRTQQRIDALNKRRR